MCTEFPFFDEELYCYEKEGDILFDADKIEDALQGVSAGSTESVASRSQCDVSLLQNGSTEEVDSATIFIIDGKRCIVQVKEELLLHNMYDLTG